MVLVDRTSDDILVIGGADVRRLLPMEVCIDLMGRTLADLSAGAAAAPVRQVLTTVDAAGDLALMPAHVGPASPFGYKSVTVFPGARQHDQPSHQAAVFLHDPATGRLLAIVDGTSITSIRTAAVSALATDLLARDNAEVMAVLGTGAQAAAHLEAIPHVRSLREIRVWGRREEPARRLVASTDVPADVRFASSAQEAVDGADVIVTATTSTRPLLRREWLADGCHINAVGSCVPTAREVDGPTVRASRIFVEDRAAAAAEAGDLLLAGRGPDDPVAVDAELGDVAAGRTPGREHDSQVTLFESLGVGVEDVAAALHVWEAARAHGRGRSVSLR